MTPDKKDWNYEVANHPETAFKKEDWHMTEADMELERKQQVITRSAKFAEEQLALGIEPEPEPKPQMDQQSQAIVGISFGLFILWIVVGVGMDLING